MASHAPEASHGKAEELDAPGGVTKKRTEYAGPIPGLAEIDARDAELRAAGIEPRNVAYGGSKVEAPVTNASSGKSPDEITDEARGMFEEVRRARAAGLDFNDDKRVEELRKKLQDEHPDFSSGFPIPFRWMVETGEFDPDVFRRWLVQTQNRKTWDTRKEWMESQAIYLSRMYKHRHPKASAKEMSEFTKRTVKALNEEEESHRKNVEEARAEVEKENAEVVAALRARLSAFVGSRTGPQLATHLHRLAEGNPEREERLRKAEASLADA